MKVIKKTGKLILNQDEADTLVKASLILDDVFETLYNIDDNDFTLIDVIGEVETTSNKLYECKEILNDFIINYGSDGIDGIEDTAKYRVEWNDSEE